MARDPVCQMEVSPHQASASTYEGQVYYFCSRSCQHEFEKNPGKHVGGSAQAGQGPGDHGGHGGGHRHGCC